MGSLRLLCCAQTASETTTHRHVRSFLAGFLRNGVGRHGSHPLVIAHQNNSTRCSLRTRQIFRMFLEYAAAVLLFWWTHLLGMACKVCRLVELRDFRAQQKSSGRELFMTACDSENNLLEHHRWQFLTSNPRAKEYMSFQCQGNHEHVWKQIHEGKREYPVALIPRLVNGFVHDLRPPQLHMFFVGSWPSVVLISCSFCCVSCSRNRRSMLRQLNVTVFKS